MLVPVGSGGNTSPGPGQEEKDVDFGRESFSRQHANAPIHHGREEDVGHTSGVLLKWLQDVAHGPSATRARSREALEEVVADVHGARNTSMTLWGGIQDGQLLADAVFTILLSRAIAVDAAASGDPTARAPLGECWSTANVLKWKSNVDAEQGGAMRA